jgi:hypothetical protein
MYGLVSKADLARSQWADVSKNLVEFQNPGRSKKQRAAEAAGATVATGGATAAVGGLLSRRRALGLAGKSEEAIKQPRMQMVARAEHTARAGAERLHAARAGKASKIGAGVTAVGLGGLAYSQRGKRKKVEFGKALTKKEREDRKGPQLPKNPVVTGGLGLGAAGAGLFGATRPVYWNQRKKSVAAEGVSTAAWKEAKGHNEAGQAAQKLSQKRKSTTSPGDALRHFAAHDEALGRAQKYSTMSTDAKAGALKTAKLGRKGLIGAVGGATAVGAGLGYDKYQKRKARQAEQM